MADDLATKLQHWEKMSELQIKLIETLGKHKLDVAKADLVSAEAAQEWAVAQMKRRVAQELNDALQRMHTIRHEAEKRIANIKNATTRALFIRLGETLDPDNVAHVWNGFHFFFNLAPQASIDAVMAMQLAPETRRGTAYSYNRDKTVACKDVPDTVENVLMLIEWMRANKYMPRIGSRAYAQVTQGFSTIAGVADEQITAMNKVISDIENGTYKTWNPLALAALPESVDVKKIISSGV